MIWEIDYDDFLGSCYQNPFILTKAAITAMNQPASLPVACATTVTVWSFKDSFYFRILNLHIIFAYQTDDYT